MCRNFVRLRVFFLEQLRNVKVVESEEGSDNHMSVLDADSTQPLLRMANTGICPKYQVRNVSRDDFFHLLGIPSSREIRQAYYHFGKVLEKHTSFMGSFFV